MRKLVFSMVGYDEANTVQAGNYFLDLETPLTERVYDFIRHDFAKKKSESRGCNLVAENVMVVAMFELDK